MSAEWRAIQREVDKNLTTGHKIPSRTQYEVSSGLWLWPKCDEGACGVKWQPVNLYDTWKKKILVRFDYNWKTKVHVLCYPNWSSPTLELNSTTQVHVLHIPQTGVHVHGLIKQCMWAYWVKQEQETGVLVDPATGRINCRGLVLTGWIVWGGVLIKGRQRRLKVTSYYYPLKQTLGPMGALQFDVLACIKLATVACIHTSSTNDDLSGDINDDNKLCESKVHFWAYCTYCEITCIHWFTFLCYTRPKLLLIQLHLSLLSILASPYAYYTQHYLSQYPHPATGGIVTFSEGCRSLQSREHAGTRSSSRA